ILQEISTTCCAAAQLRFPSLSGNLHFSTPLERPEMSMRDRLQQALKDAMKAKDALRLSTLRLINAAIKDRDIASRGDGEAETVPDSEITAILAKLVKQRQESARAYEEGGRLELAEKELAEIVVIQEFLPRQISAEEVAEALNAAIAETGASSIRDVGK